MNIPICSKCNKPTKRQCGPSETTLLYFPFIYDENGTNINPSKNTITIPWICLECGNEWVETIKEG